MIVRRILFVFASLLVMVFVALYGVLYVTLRGPSETARDKLVLSCLESSAAKFVPYMFLKDELVKWIVEYNSIVESFAVTDATLVSFSDEYTDSEDDEWADYPDGIRIENIWGPTYRGYVMLIRDPSRVYCGTSSNFRSGAPGIKILDISRRDEAVAAINGGGFPDDSGVGPGDVPRGLVFSKGQHLWGEENTVYSAVMGFNQDNVLIVGNMSPKQAREMGIRDALCFGPILVTNGERPQIRGTAGGLNPRSAIGQRADGVVIFLCVDGRMPSSLGASFADLIDIMIEFGAVNAANLDGGTSSNLVYNHKIININSSLYGPRRIPTFFMVAPEEK